jgi:hypothetical protein
MSEIEDEWTGWIPIVIIYGLLLSATLFEVGVIISVTGPPFHPMVHPKEGVFEIKGWGVVLLENGTIICVPINVTRVVVVIKT